MPDPGGDRRVLAMVDRKRPVCMLRWHPTRDGRTQDMDSCSLLHEHGHQVGGRLEPDQSAEND